MADAVGGGAERDPGAGEGSCLRGGEAIDERAAGRFQAGCLDGFAGLGTDQLGKLLPLGVDPVGDGFEQLGAAPGRKRLLHRGRGGADRLLGLDAPRGAHRRERDTGVGRHDIE